MRERRRLDEAISATRAIETECADTAELIELAEMEGDEAMVDEAVASLGVLAARAEEDKIKALLAGEADGNDRSEEHTSELQSLMRISYAVFCLKKKTINKTTEESM